MADSSNATNPIKARKKGTRNATRPRPLPPDVTARNLAYEKERRQALNEDFLDLARLVPSLATARRLSKVLIVNEAKRHLSQRRAMCVTAARDVQALLDENARLAAELNATRLPKPAAEPHRPTDALKELMEVENEPSGVFPPGSWDNWSGRPRKPSESKKDETSTAPQPEPSVQENALSNQSSPPPASTTKDPEVPVVAQKENFSEEFISGFEVESYLPPDMMELYTEWPDSLHDPWQPLPSTDGLQFYE